MLTPRHLHPVPVVGYVESGEFVVKIQGQLENHYKAGDVTYEPANAVIERFDNVSKTVPAVLIASYLADDNDKELIKLLPK